MLRAKLEDKIPGISNSATKTTLNAKINQVKIEIPDITNLANKAAIKAVKNKIPSVSYNTKINEIEKKITDNNHDKYITTPEFNKLTSENFAVRLKQANLASKSDIANFVKKTSFDQKLKHLNKTITSNKTKHLPVENEFKKIQTFGSSLFIGQTYFDNHAAQPYLIFQPFYKTITIFSGLSNIISE